MGIQQVAFNPGTPESEAYWPFKVNTLGGDWVAVNQGEIFYDPLIGGEVLDVKGFDVPFRVNDKSFIYLQVFFDLCGRPTHAGIAHTGRNLQWLMPGERWLNYPRMFATNKMPYFGLWMEESFHGIEQRAEGYHHTWKGRPEDWNLAAEGWFSSERGEGEGGAAPGFKGETTPWGAKHPLHEDMGRGKKDTELTANVADQNLLKAGKLFLSNQIYTGIDRELRKDVSAQGLNMTNPKHNNYPWNLKDVGWYAQPGVNPEPYDERRQKLGYLDQAGKWNPIGGQRGLQEFGGYMNPAYNPHAGGVWQEGSFRTTYNKIQKWCFRTVTKLWKTHMDQVMAFYPIAYATRKGRPLEDGFIGGGLTIQGGSGEDYQGNKYHDPEFQLVQACKTNLRLSTVLEGDARYKVLVPYQGMDSMLDTRDGWSTTNFLNFPQRWDQHAQSSSTAVPNPDFQKGGSNYYKRETGADLPYEQDYLDAMFNNQENT